jgi:hypothetical protein
VNTELARYDEEVKQNLEKGCKSFNFETSYPKLMFPFLMNRYDEVIPIFDYTKAKITVTCGMSGKFEWRET